MLSPVPDLCCQPWHALAVWKSSKFAAMELSLDVGPASVLAPLRSICLDYRCPPEVHSSGETQVSKVAALPQSAQHALSAATALHTLELRVVWDGVVSRLCHALPSLRSLRWVRGLWKEATLREATAVAVGGPLLCILTFLLRPAGCTFIAAAPRLPRLPCAC